jgi:iron complex outermembrane receptor protein
MLDAAITYRVRLGPSQIEWFARGSNLLNAEARQHTSFLKEVAPHGRRGAMIGVRASF